MTKNQTIILKIGGSLITEKRSARPQIKKAMIRQLADELKMFVQRFPQIKIILLHGAGSFGHPFVYRYKLLERPLTGTQLLNFTETVCSVRRLANLLTDSFLTANLPVLPIQTSAALFEKNNTINLLNIPYIKQILNIGFIPLLGGDMGMTKKNQPIVVSADRLVVLLAEVFPVSKIIFATDVDGIFEKFPPLSNARPLPFLSRKNLKRLLINMPEQKNQYDVTDGMAGKLQTMLLLKEREVVIVNGQKQGNITKAMIGKPIGTRLAL